MADSQTQPRPHWFASERWKTRLSTTLNREMKKGISWKLLNTSGVRFFIMDLSRKASDIQGWTTRLLKGTIWMAQWFDGSPAHSSNGNLCSEHADHFEITSHLLFTFSFRAVHDQLPSSVPKFTFPEHLLAKQLRTMAHLVSRCSAQKYSWKASTWKSQLFWIK